MIMDFLQGMNIWRWLIVAALFFIAELATGTTYLLWLAVAAVLVGIATILPVGTPWEIQFVAFAVISVTLIAFGRKVIKPGWLKSDAPQLNDPAAQMRGEVGVAVEAFAGPYGRVKIGDTEWRALQVEGETLTGGDRVEILDVDGATLKVRKA